jgi:hypothetical protein
MRSAFADSSALADSETLRVPCATRLDDMSFCARVRYVESYSEMFAWRLRLIAACA